MPAEPDRPRRLVPEPADVRAERLRQAADYYTRNGAPLCGARYAEMADQIERVAAKEVDRGG